MDGKMIVGIALIVGVVSIVLLAAPVQAYVNGTGNGDLLQTQDRHRMRTREQDRDGNMLQTQDRESLRTQNGERTCDCTRTQHRCRQRTNECSTNGICNCTMSLKQYRNQTRERMRSLWP